MEDSHPYIPEELIDVIEDRSAFLRSGPETSRYERDV